MEGEDGRPAGGSCAVESHVQDAMWGLDTVLLRGGKGKDLEDNAIFVCTPTQDSFCQWKRNLKANSPTCPWSRSILAASSASCDEEQMKACMWF